MNNVFVHSTALVETDEIGDGSRIWAYTHIMQSVRIGKNCNIGDHCFIESGVSIGENTTIKNCNMIYEGVCLENGVFVGSHVSFTNDLYPRSPRLPQAQRRYCSREHWLVPTRVKTGASLGTSAIILAGATIGEYAMVGAGAVVTKAVPPYALVTGNPAKLCKWVCQCGWPLDFDNSLATCAKCELQYQRENDGVHKQT